MSEESCLETTKRKQQEKREEMNSENTSASFYSFFEAS
jgi:hypothetical protein